jgi:hypothetical protein
MARAALETSATFQDLERFLAGPGCALCRYVAQSEHRYFDTLLYENVTEPATERRMRASQGLCARHLAALLGWRDALATAILYKPVLNDKRRLLAQWRRGQARGAGRPDPRLAAIGLDCPACEAEREGQRRAAEVLAGGLDGGALAEPWRRSDGLCWRHFVAVRPLARAGRALLDQVQAERLDALAADVQAFIDSFDYRHQGERPPQVETSWRRLVAVLGGRLWGEGERRGRGGGATEAPDGQARSSGQEAGPGESGR